MNILREHFFISSVNYEVFAKDFDRSYDDEEFYDMKTAKELSNIFDFCNFSTIKFISRT